jgi:hypothetical protein
MSNSAANAAAKRRRGATQQPMSQSNQSNQLNQQTTVTPTLTVPQSIYLLSNRINHLEAQLHQAINSNAIGEVNNNNTNENTIIHENAQQVSSPITDTDNFIAKSDFNDVMTSIGSDMNGLSQKMNTLNEFVLSIQNSYLGLNKAILEIQQKATVLNNSNNISLDISNDNNNLADFNAIDNEEDRSNVKEEDNSNVEEEDNSNVENTTLIVEEDQAPSHVVAADITSRLKMLSAKSNVENNNITVEDVSDEEEEEA